MLYQYRREANDVTKSLDDLAVICAEQGISHFEASVAMLRGWADVTQGKCDKGIVQLQHGMAMHDRSPAGLRKAYYAALLVEGYLRRGDVDSGLSQIEASLARVKDVGDHHWRPELLRLRGDLLALVPDQKAAEKAFKEALACAREQRCRMLELRAAVSLSRLWAAEGESGRAHALLSPLYAEFTEGFDTYDLKDAKALRDQLSQ
jgi:predicted ATPase